MKNEDKPIYAFLTVGVGVGKTKTTKSHPNDPKVLFAAPTEKAAFLIIGNTMHGLFQIPTNRMLQYIHQRLQQITGSRKHIAGISILAVGDLFQLKPVFDG